MLEGGRDKGQAIDWEIQAAAAGLYPPIPKGLSPEEHHQILEARTQRMRDAQAETKRRKEARERRERMRDRECHAQMVAAEVLCALIRRDARTDVPTREYVKRAFDVAEAFVDEATRRDAALKLMLEGEDALD
jgi:uncharacterized Fe-S cluster-containing radical SAM superfamily protein